MKEYQVRIIERLEMTVTVESESACEAKQAVEDAWYAGEYILDADHFTGAEFKVEEIK